MANLLKKIFERPYDWKKNGHDTTDQWKFIRTGDTVEFAMTVTEDVEYTVEALYPETQEAMIKRKTSDGSNGETYRVGVVMLRPIKS
ncbi:MAG: hypothetical protein FJ219_06185 [Ignavibacteria bacterium]|jgi:hypothetical protein|nr:hypothetical protein [Ignavibacteria bacterium]